MTAASASPISRPRERRLRSSDAMNPSSAVPATAPVAASLATFCAIRHATNHVISTRATSPRIP